MSNFGIPHFWVSGSYVEMLSDGLFSLILFALIHSGKKRTITPVPRSVSEEFRAPVGVLSFTSL